MASENTIDLPSEDLSQLELELDGPPVLDYLTVFVRDPENPDQYWLRKMEVKGDSQSESRVKNTLKWIVEHTPWAKKEHSQEDHSQWRTYANVLDMGFNDRPCPESAIDRERAFINNEEETLRNHPDGKMRELHSVVGVARYLGDSKLALDDVLNLVGMRYHQMKASYLN